MNKYEKIPEDTIDLHGKTVREALEYLEDYFLEHDYKHIRIITGKAAFRETGPVLRTAVENFLKNKNIRFEYAKLYNGGEGALEVYLK